MPTPRAFITGITGQDGSHLAELLLDQGYEVHGLVHRPAAQAASNIRHFVAEAHRLNKRLLGWQNTVPFQDRVARLVESELKKAA